MPPDSTSVPAVSRTVFASDTPSFATGSWTQLLASSTQRRGSNWRSAAIRIASPRAPTSSAPDQVFSRPSKLTSRIIRSNTMAVKRWVRIFSATARGSITSSEAASQASSSLRRRSGRELAVAAPPAPPSPVGGAGTGVCAPSCLALPGGASNPLNYPASTVQLGNGIGFASEIPAFGFPAGASGPDNRISLYFGDAWKIKPNLTLTYGLRYVRDTGRSDSDLGSIAALNQFNNQFYSGIGNRVNNPNKNFAPQLGIAWDPLKNGKTVIRGGIGLFYENAIWNNVLFDR